MNAGSDIPIRIAPRRELAEEWALVLVAEGLSPSVWHAAEGFMLGVPGDQVESATSVLSSYDSENPPRPPVDDEPKGRAHIYTALFFSIALLDFFFITDVWSEALPWVDRGGADAKRIVGGELWRIVTALTLHADLKHALANAIAGALFVGAVCRSLGSGFGFAIVLLAGAGGNLVNALFYGSYHVAIGASTAVFGALGVLGGVGAVRRRRSGMHGRHVWVPIAAGLALLAMLGTAGERVDLLGHLFGFLVGGVLGLGVAYALPRRPAPRVQWALGLSALVVIFLSWAWALAYTPAGIA
ncbi:MAG: rhomboid family intramembrane serine protease [Acidiferrobacterales bacterium]